MKKSKTTLVVGAILVPVVLVSLLIVNWFVYPFTTAKPNFADVEAVYSRMVVPSEWKLIEEGSNKGLAGRQCPIESDGCFSKSGSFNIPQSDYVTSVENLTKSLGCVSVSIRKSEQKDGPSSSNFECASGALRVSGTVVERSSEWTAYVSVSSR